MADSLIIARHIELLGGGGGSVSTIAACAGAKFQLLPSPTAGSVGGGSWDMGAPQPTTDLVGSLVLDGERPFGRRASNRVISLPVKITAPDFATLSAAREVLLQAVDAQVWELKWTRDKGGQLADLPVIFDCFRANPSTITWGGADQYGLHPIAVISLSFQALPYGRSDVKSTIAVASPLPGQPIPPTAKVLDTYSTVSGSNWVQSTACVIGPKSAKWDPCIAPISDCTGGEGNFPVYTKTGLNLNLTGLNALSAWVGLGSTDWPTWHKGNVVFAWTLTDNNGHTLPFGVVKYLHASYNGDIPNWTLVTATIPSQNAAGSFNFAQVTGYTITMANDVDFNGLSMEFLKVYLDTPTANPPSIQRFTPSVRGSMYSLMGVAGTARTPIWAQFQQSPAAAVTRTVILPGPAGTPQTWKCPPGVSTVKVECTGGGGAGGSTTVALYGSAGGGGGGGEYAAEASVAVVAGQIYNYIMGASGQPVFRANGTAGGDTTFTGTSVTVTAHGGGGGQGGVAAGTGAAGGTGSTNTTHFAGGAGAAGVSSGSAGGGGGSAGSGSVGGAASGVVGGAGGSGTTAGWAGSYGAGPLGHNANAAGPPGGAGGGSTTGYADHTGGAGGAGQVQLTYTSTVIPFSTLIAHRPGPDAPANLTPIVSVGDNDVPNNGTEYPVPSPVTGQNAEFSGTYSVVAVASAWNTPGAARTVTVTVRQYEYQGGPHYDTTIARTFTPNTDTFTPGGATYSQVPMVELGELTLPLKYLASDNSSALFTVLINDTDTFDRFLDILFIDTQGQTVMVGEAASGAYLNYYVDAPGTDVDIGAVLGSNFDRSQALSVLDATKVSGGPLYLDPGDNLLLCYAVEGAPALSVIYFPQWWLDRLY